MCPRGRPRGQGRPRGLHLWLLQLAADTLQGESALTISVFILSILRLFFLCFVCGNFANDLKSLLRVDYEGVLQLSPQILYGT